MVSVRASSFTGVLLQEDRAQKVSLWLNAKHGQDALPLIFIWCRMYDYPPPPQTEYHFSLNLASIVKLPPNPENNVSYKDLQCSEQDRANIEEIISTIAVNSKFSLLLKQAHLRNIGAQINHVHPLKFLTVATSSPQMKGFLAVILDDYFKRNGFFADGLFPSLTREADKGKLRIYLPDFAVETGASQEALDPYFQSRDWEGLIRFLIQ
ncbi:MAG: hypothetical protein HY861_01970 [Chlamydiia bacterium]|nr:hypothetical protein [Chlamydiia bacterium]